MLNYIYKSILTSDRSLKGPRRRTYIAINVDLFFSYKKPLPRGSRKKLSAVVQRARAYSVYIILLSLQPLLIEISRLGTHTEPARVYSLKIIYLETLYQGQRPASRTLAGVLLYLWARLRFAYITIM
jgi:hypothetical protein